MIDDGRLDRFLRILSKLEGGVSNHPLDKGGLTNLGVTQDTYTNYLIKKKKPKKSVLKITQDEVKDIYKTEYYDRIGYIEDEYPHYLMFDLAVNSGPARAKQCVSEIDNPHNPANILTWRRNYYNKIVANNPEQSVFLKGWMARLKLIEKEFKA